jgi:hypothetical protein
VGVVVVAWFVDIDGTDITQYCQQITWSPKLSRPASCVVRVPATLVSASIGVSEMHLYNGGLLFSGPVWYIQADGDENAGYLEVTAYDHLVYLTKHLCKTGSGYPPEDFPENSPPTSPGPCNLADPTRVITDNVTATEVFAAFINATQYCDPGSFPVSVNSVATGGPSIEGFPTDFPMSLATMADTLLGTGQLDIIVNPGFGSSTVDLYNGDAGTNRTGSVVLQYATGSFNSRRANRTRDMDEVINALWYLLGPKLDKYTGDISHWMGSITPTAPYDCDYHPTNCTWPPSLISRWTGSRATYGYMQEVQVHDSRDDEQKIRDLFVEIYANEAYIRAVPRTFASVTPDRSASAPGFAVADLITLTGGPILGGAAFTGGFRVYGFEVSIDVDGIGEITSIEGSTDQE